jgi:hypothetical protein
VLFGGDTVLFVGEEVFVLFGDEEAFEEVVEEVFVLFASSGFVLLSFLSSILSFIVFGVMLSTCIVSISVVVTVVSLFVVSIVFKMACRERGELLKGLH